MRREPGARAGKQVRVAGSLTPLSQRLPGGPAHLRAGGLVAGAARKALESSTLGRGCLLGLQPRDAASLHTGGSHPAPCV